MRVDTHHWNGSIWLHLQQYYSHLDDIVTLRGKTKLEVKLDNNPTKFVECLAYMQEIGDKSVQLTIKAISVSTYSASLTIRPIRPGPRAPHIKGPPHSRVYLFLPSSAQTPA